MTSDPERLDCFKIQKPWIVNCNYNLAFNMMSYLNGPILDPVSFNESRIFSFPQNSSVTGINDLGFAYIPEQCERMTCKVHFQLHGCDMNFKSINLEWV